jgi:hypothetical protein
MQWVTTMLWLHAVSNCDAITTMQWVTATLWLHMQYSCSTHANLMQYSAVLIQYSCKPHAILMQYSCSTHAVTAWVTTKAAQSLCTSLPLYAWANLHIHVYWNSHTHTHSYLNFPEGSSCSSNRLDLGSSCEVWCFISRCRALCLMCSKLREAALVRGWCAPRAAWNTCVCVHEHVCVCLCVRRYI